MERKALIKRNRKYDSIYIVFLIGILGHISEKTFDLMLAITPITLFVMGTYVLYQTVKQNGVPVLLWMGGVFSVTFALEVAGVKTGVIFGGYEYGKILEPSLFGVPLIIGYNWVFVILGAASMVRRLNSKPLIFALIAGAIAVAFDYLLEPVAIGLGYWSWDTGYVPLQNYAAWFVIGFTAAYMLARMRIAFFSGFAVHYLIAQIIFFLALSVII